MKTKHANSSGFESNHKSINHLIGYEESLKNPFGCLKPLKKPL